MFDKAEFLLNLSFSKIDKLETALDHNWMAHLIMAGIGLALVFDLGNLPAYLAKYFGQEQYDKRAVSLIFLFILLYFFLKLGYLLTTFMKVRRLHDDILKEYLKTEYKDPKMHPLHGSNNFFEIFYAPNAFAQ